MPATATDKATSNKKSSCHSGLTSHPNHSHVIPRLNRAEGQIAGIKKMIEEGRYCVDILTQFRACMSALRTIEMTVFETHLKSCVRTAMEAKNPAEANKKIEEITNLLVKRTMI